MQMLVRERNNTIEIQLSRLAGRQQVVLQALDGVLVDRSKLESMSLRTRADAMSVRLEAKAGERLDPSELYRQLRHALLSAAGAFLQPAR